MASKVPSDPNLTPEMRRFLDDTSRAEGRLTTYVDDQIDANALILATQVEAEAGAQNTHYMTPLRTAEAIAALATVPAFTKSFVSADQTITSAGALTLAHSLGATPKLLVLMLKNTTAEGNYSIGDLTQAVGGFPSIVPDATNLNIRFGSAASCFSIVNKTTGAALLATNANWVAIFSAYA